MPAPSDGWAAGPHADPLRWRALGVGISALALVLLDLSIVNVILPPIGAATGASPPQLLWVVSGYALAIGVVPIIAGRFGDDYGRRRMLLVGVAGFVVMSAVVGLSPSIEVIIAARVLQGLAGGLINPQISGVVQELFPPGERARAFGRIGAAVGVFTAIGPVIGGGLVALGGAELGWRLCFLVNVPAGIAVFALARIWWPAPNRQVHRRLDLTGAGLLTIALLCLLFPAVEFTTRRDGRLAALLIPALAFVAVFRWWEGGPARRRGYPLVDVALLRIRSFANGIWVGLLFFCAFNGLGLVLALYLQEGIGLSAAQAGCVVALYAVGTVAGALAGGRILSRRGSAVVPVALGVFAVGVAATGVVAATQSGHVAPAILVAALSAPLLVAGLGGGGVVSPNQTLSLADLGSLGGSTAGGMLQTAQRIGNAVGAAVISATYYFVATSAEPPTRSAQATHHGQAYALALLVALVFALGALAFSIGEVRRRRRREPVTSAEWLAEEGAA